MRLILNKEIVSENRFQEEFRQSIMADIWQGTGLGAIDTEQMAVWLHTELAGVFRALIQMLQERIIGKIKSPLGVKTPQMIRIIQPGLGRKGFGFFPAEATRRNIGPGRVNKRQPGGTGVMYDVNKRVRNAVANQLEPNLRRDMVLSWKPLQPATLKRKDPRNARFYFLNKGDLRNEINQKLTDLASDADKLFKISANGRTLQAAKTEYWGEQKVQRQVYRDELGRFAKGWGSFRVGSLEIELLPGLSQTLPGLLSSNISETSRDGRFEDAMGFSESAKRKLLGREEYHRPLLQPLMTYYLLYEAPAQIAKAIRGT